MVPISLYNDNSLIFLFFTYIISFFGNDITGFVNFEVIDALWEIGALFAVWFNVPDLFGSWFGLILCLFV